jgi:ribosomal protein S18 acetylase RimI-like enzyme
MSKRGPIDFRLATAADAESVASLHADSWRRHYRGAYSDEFLDGDVEQERSEAWAARFSADDGRSRTVLAERDGHLVGFAHLILDEDATWGSLLDNLHVSHALKRQGIGAELVQRVAHAVVNEARLPGLFLWVLEQNTAAQAFYRSLGGRLEDSKVVRSPGNVPGRLSGTPRGVRVAWSDASVLLARDPQAVKALQSRALPSTG